MPDPDLDRLLHDNSALPADWNGMIAVADIRKLVAEVKTLRAHLAERAGGRTPEADVTPTDALLFCPACGLQHVDAPEPERGWTNPPHKSHLCHGCGTIWRPADVPTNGVATIQTTGAADTWRLSAARLNVAPASPEGRAPTCPTCAERAGQLVAAQEGVVLKPWVLTLPWRQQSTLFSALRGPDIPSVAAQEIVRWIRGVVQKDACEAEGIAHLCTYMLDERATPTRATTGGEHFQHHLDAALRVIAERHPEASIATVARAALSASPTSRDPESSDPLAAPPRAPHPDCICSAQGRRTHGPNCGSHPGDRDDTAEGSHGA